MEKEIHKKSLLGRWKSRDNKESTTLLKAPEKIDLPLSSGQQRLFFLDKLYPNNPVYNSSEIYNFKGNLNVERLKQSLKTIFVANDVFRCSFHFVNGKPIQKIHDDLEFDISLYDLKNLSDSDREKQKQQILNDDSLKSFDLSKPPLIRASIIIVNPEEHILFLTVHHIITDKWSMGIFQEKLAHYYKNNLSADEVDNAQDAIQFTDYAYWQDKTEVDEKQLEYWKNKLSGSIPLLALPTDYPQPVIPSFKGGSHVQELPEELSEKVLKLCQELDVTPYVLLLSVYYIMLYKYTAQSDILIGSPISVRGSKVLEDIIGFFDETIVLRTNVSGQLPFREFVQQVRSTVLDAFNNKDVPFDQLVRELRPERSISGSPFFRTMFIYHDVPEMPIFDSEIDLSYTFYNTGISKFDLTLYISNAEGLLSTEFEYAKDLFDIVSIERFQEHFKLLLEGVIDNQELSVHEIPMRSADELLLLEGEKKSNKKHFEKYSAIHEIILEQARKNPDKIAIAFGDESMTYKELDYKSNQVANYVLKYSKGENGTVGLCIERSITMVVGLVGILKAGCAYLPIDLNYPSKRIAYILQDSAVSILLTQEKLKSNFEKFKGNKLVVDTEIDFNSKATVELAKVKESDLAYVIYTSGSTGKPKGVPITHANILSSTEARLNFYEDNPSAFLLMSSISFDSSKAGVFWTLCTGGTLVVSEPGLEQDIAKLSQVISENSISHTLMLPSLYKMVLDFGDIRNLKSLKSVIVAGEECTPFLCKEHFNKLPKAELYNEYGPTEATVWCIAHKIEKGANDSIVPIGRATSNANIYLLNESQEAVPYGATGEIYVGGSSLSGSYLNRPELTKAAYVKSPFGKNDTDVLYRTGDLGRFRNDGAIEFLGRTDNQVKIRGFRIELNEIENALMRNEVVGEAVVMAESIGGNDMNKNAKATKRLVAYVVSKEPIDTNALKQELLAEIPSYMVPVNIIDVDKFPELPNGKVDKKALLEFGEAVRSKSAVNVIKPISETEAKLVEIWEEVLNHSNISTRDNYYEIGGDSLTSIKMFWLIEKSMNVKLSPNTLFNYPTIEDIARKIKNDKIERTKDFKYVVPYRTEGSKNPLFCIHGGEGHVLFYQNFANYIDSDRPVYFVQPRGADGDNTLHTSIEEMAEAYLVEILQVYTEETINLVFYCCGALVVEISNRLKILGKKVNISIIDSSPKYAAEVSQKKEFQYSHFLKKVLSNPLGTLKKSIVYRFRRYVLPIYVSMLRDEFIKRHIRIRARLEQVQSDYSWKEFDANCTLILGTDGLSDFDSKDIDGWNHWCTTEINVLYNSGNHFNIFEKPHVKTLGETVEKICQ